MYGVTVKKLGNSIGFFELRLSSLTIAPDLQIGTISENCRPIASRFLVGIGRDEVMFNVTINPTGVVKLSSYSSDSSTTAYYPIICGCYFI